jgi:hypothetical protein
MSMVDAINNLSDYVLALEQENERLKLQLQSKGNEPDARDEFIRMMEPYMAVQESKYGQGLTESMSEIVRAYRKAKEIAS